MCDPAKYLDLYNAESESVSQLLGTLRRARKFGVHTLNLNKVDDQHLEESIFAISRFLLSHVLNIDDGYWSDDSNGSYLRLAIANDHPVSRDAIDLLRIAHTPETLKRDIF